MDYLQCLFENDGSDAGAILFIMLSLIVLCLIILYLIRGISYLYKKIPYEKTIKFEKVTYKVVGIPLKWIGKTTLVIIAVIFGSIIAYGLLYKIIWLGTQQIFQCM